MSATPSWDDLRVYLSVARQGSLSGAGTVLMLDPATVGRRIARLEEVLGAALFMKSPQGYALTEAGERMMAYAVEAEHAMMGAEDAVRGQEDRLTGTIRIGAPDGCANFLLPQVLSEIAEAHPDLDLQLVAQPRVFNLNRREADMAIGVSRPTAGRLMVQKVADYRLYLAASRRYLRHAPDIESMDDLKDHRFIGYVQDMIFDKELDYLDGLNLKRVALSSNSVAVQFHMAKQGAGVSIMHDFVLAAAPRLVKILTDDFALTRTFYLIRHADDARVRRLSRFAEILVETMRRELVRLQED